MSFLLQSLSGLELEPGVLPLPASSALAGASPDHRQIHLLLLFAQFTDCIGVGDAEFQALLKQIFHLVSRSLGLEQR